MLYLLIAINIIIWIVVTLCGLIIRPDILTDILALPASPEIFLSRPWSLITYMVVHSSFLHLVFNMLWLFWFGSILLEGGLRPIRISGGDMVKGWPGLLKIFFGKQIISSASLRFLMLYIGGGITGGLAYLAVAASGFHSAGSYLLGASASVMAVICCAAFRYPAMPLNLFLIGTVKLKWVAVGCIALTLLGLGGGNAGGQAAHAGGVLFGAIWYVATRANGKRSGHISRPPGAAHGIQPNKGKPRKPVAPPQTLHDPSAFSNRLRDEERLDRLLDKIRVSGYDSLTETEKRELNAISSRL